MSDLNGYLCARCTQGLVYRRSLDAEPVAWCRVMHREVPPIVECSDFHATYKTGIEGLDIVSTEVPILRDGKKNTGF